MAKVKLLKNLNSYKVGETIEVPDQRIDYLVRCGIAEVLGHNTDASKEVIPVVNIKKEKHKPCKSC